MQHIDQPPEPADFGQIKKVIKERAALDEFYGKTENAAAPYPGALSAYKDARIKAALEAAFYGKCAYCETAYQASQPMAVEHYRPKGGVLVDGKLQPPGYWWLASDWSNLMPSCTDCNSPRKQDFPRGIKPATAGKANQFPLPPRAKRALSRGGEKHEKRLLLNPYLDLPEEHLHFVSGKGFRAGEVEPRRIGPARRPSREARASIEVYALQRRGLIEERKKVLRKLEAHLDSVEFVFSLVLKDPNDQALMARYEQTLADAALFTAVEQPYSAMCRQVADEFMSTRLRRQP